jgi:UDP-N-acetylglucosamine 2-epimerase (non-hydrolysing)
MEKKRVCCIVGTRPEAIKMAPVILDLATREWADVIVVCTSQHRDTVLPILGFFGIEVHHDLDVMVPNQDLSSLTARLLFALGPLLGRLKPDAVLAQGDTTTVFAAALTCFYQSIPFGHIEAGLRSGRLDNPFPEEFNRIACDMVSAWHFVPTDAGHRHLMRELPQAKSVFVTGNTVIDALRLVAERDQRPPITLRQGTRLLLVTLHRRESHGEPLVGILHALKDLLNLEADLEILLPVHPNPNVSGPVHDVLGSQPRVHLTPPLSYPDLVAALKLCTLVLTDSGGIQEEAPSLGKPVLVARTTTERPEAVDAGVAALVGTDPAKIISLVRQLLGDTATYQRMSRGASPYGDGQAAQRIGDILAGSFGLEARPRATVPEFAYVL